MSGFTWRMCSKSQGQRGPRDGEAAARSRRSCSLHPDGRRESVQIYLAIASNHGTALATFNWTRQRRLGRVGWARGLGAWAGRVGWARGLGAWAGVVIMTTNCIVGSWLENFPLLPNGKVEEGLVVWSRSGTIEGRTTGYRCPCYVPAYEGRFICVNCETGQPMKICSECWECDSPTCEVHLAKGGEISSRFTCGATKDRPPLPREEWPDRRELRACKGWRIRSAS
jgi:hypothetical protein